MGTLSSKSKIHLSVGLFVVMFFVLLTASVVFLIIEKRTFAEFKHVTLSSASAAALNEGMPLLFSGFEIGRIDKLTLNDDGRVIVDLKVPVEHEKRITDSSKFRLEKPVIGLAKLIVSTEKSAKDATPSADDHVFQLEVVDELTGLISVLPMLTDKISRIALNLERMTDEDSALNHSLLNLQSVTGQLADNRGADLLVGEDGGKQLHESIAALTRTLKESAFLLGSASRTLDTAKERVLGQDGTVAKVNDIADDVAAKLKTLDALVASLVIMGENLKGSTGDLSVLRGSIDSTVSSANALITDIRNKLPMKQEKEIPLP